MKTQTWGLSYHSLVTSSLFAYVLSSPFSCRNTVHDFISHRLNGDPSSDAPKDRTMPAYKYDRDFVWTKGELKSDGFVYGVKRPDGYYDYELQYNPAPDVILWVEEMDRNYILRLEQEEKLLEIEPHADTEIVQTHKFHKEICDAMARVRAKQDPERQRKEAKQKAKAEQAEQKAKAEAEKQAKAEEKEEAERKAKAEAEQKAREEETESRLGIIEQQTLLSVPLDRNLTAHQLAETESRLREVQEKLQGVSFFNFLARSQLEAQHQELLALVARYRDEQNIEQQRNYIEAHPPLYDYYMTIRIQLCCMFTAAQAIHSELVADGRQGIAAKTQQTAEQVIKLSNFIPIVGPMLATAVHYLIQGLSVIGETIYKKRLTEGINRVVGVNGLAPDSTEMSKLAEQVARQLTFGSETKLMSPEQSKSVLAKGKQKALEFKDWVAANSHDSPAKKQAADDVQSMVKQIMKNGLNQTAPKADQLIKMILGEQLIVIPNLSSTQKVKVTEKQESHRVIVHELSVTPVIAVEPGLTSSEKAEKSEMDALKELVAKQERLLQQALAQAAIATKEVKELKAALDMPTGNGSQVQIPKSPLAIRGQQTLSDAPQKFAEHDERLRRVETIVSTMAENAGSSQFFLTPQKIVQRTALMETTEEQQQREGRAEIL